MTSFGLRSFAVTLTFLLAMVVMVSFLGVNGQELEPDSETGVSKEETPLQSCSLEDSFVCDPTDGVECIALSNVCNGQVDCPNGFDESVETCDCLPTEFQCNATVCIDKLQRCDGIPDCEDGLDEEECEIYICHDTRSKCDNHKCVPRDKACDFVDDCGDGSDEKYCERRKCDPTEFQCNNGECVVGTYLCNNITDCVDGSDEDQCDTRHFRCPMGYYLEERFHCDDWVECFFSHADEANCRPCMEGEEYKCPSNGQCIKAGNVCDGVCDCIQCEDEDECDSYECPVGEKFLCSSKKGPPVHCIDKEYVCDGHKNECLDNLKGADELSCSWGEMNCSWFDTHRKVPHMMCDDNRCIANDSICDHKPDCYDGSDEMNCDYKLVKCGKDEFQCKSGDCIPLAHRCDTFFDCLDRSDEGQCHEFQCPVGTRRCKSGHCIEVDKWCDSWRDCLDGSDERWCERPVTCKADEFRCQSGQCIDKGLACIFTTDRNGCADKSHLFNCSTYVCPPGMFKCRNSYCIDASRECDGRIDCRYDKWDESHCRYWCPIRNKVCICDNKNAMYCDSRNLTKFPEMMKEEHYPKLYFQSNRLILKNDTFENEVYDKVTQLDLSNNSLTDLPDNVFKSMWRLTHLTLTYNNISILRKNMFVGLASLKQINLKVNHITSIEGDVFVPLRKVMALDLSNQELTNISANIFKGLRGALKLDLSFNKITEVENGAFNGLGELISLDLSNNRIEVLPARVFVGLTKLKKLDISYNKIHHVAGGVFQALQKIEDIKMSMNMLKELPDDVFKDLHKLENLETDAYKFCCLASTSVQCLPEPNEFSSCEDLMSNHVLRISIWILGILALVGNLVVIFWRLRDFRGGRVHSFLITNLAIGDFLMGVYLIIIATVDTRYRGNYIIHDENWRQSGLCRFAGFVSTFSSELSVLTLTTITLDRLICILFPLKRPNMGLKQAAVVMVFIWSFVFFISLLPLSGLGYFKDFYGRSGVCLALHVTPDRPSGWEYSVGLFLVLNLASFILIAASYLWMFSVAKKTRSAVRTPESRNDNAMARRMTIIVMTDFCCWVPIIVLGLASLAGIRADNQVYAWIAVFVLPLNSATNPILYTISTAPFLGKIRKRATRFRKSFINSITAEGKNSYVEERTTNSYCERKSPYRQMELVRLRSLNNTSLTFYSRDQYET